MAKQRDWILRLILAYSGLALTASLLVFILYLLRLLVSPHDLLRVDFSKLPLLQAENLVNIGLFLFLLALLLYAAAQQRAMTNMQLRSSSGCPACSGLKLIRVPRHKRDRLLAYSLIPMGRFVCPECRWEGRRIIRRSDYLRKKGKPKTAAKPTSRIDAEAADSLVEVHKQSAKAAGAVVEMIPATKIQAVLSSNSDIKAIIAGRDFQLADQGATHLITIHSGESGVGMEPGAVVGSLRLLLWQNSGPDGGLRAYLDHDTTKLTLYDRIKAAEWTPEYSNHQNNNGLQS